MPDYETIDISTLCNLGAEFLEEEHPKLGMQTFRGLPFLIGNEAGEGQCYVSLSGGEDSVTIPIGRTASRVIFAHRLMETHQHLNGPVDTEVAHYVFHLSGQEPVTSSIRERYDINPIGDRRGIPRQGIGYPFLAVPDQGDTTLERYEGRFDQSGRRQTEVALANPKWYYLWVWTNSNPEVVIDSIEIIPKGPRFIIAGLTLGHIDEHPFSREGRRPVIVTLKNPETAAKSWDTRVDIDRGESTYEFPLSTTSTEEFLADYPGFGEECNVTSSPAYVEIAGIGSGNVNVRQGQDTLAEINWGEIQEHGTVENDEVRIEIVDPGKNWVRVRVLDDETGQPVSCKIHFRSPQGLPYQPHGHHNQVNSGQDTWHIDVGGDVKLGQITYAYIDGTCQGWLPRGDVIVDVSRGYEYDPVRKKVIIEPGQQDLELRIKRWINMNDHGWYSGDSHVHFLSTQGCHFEAKGEDLNVVNLLQSQWGSLFTNVEDFIGRPSVTQDGKSIVYTAQENRQHFLGHMILWGLKDPIMPFCSDGPSESELATTMETTLSHWADAAHDQGGWVINPHFPFPNGEPAALVATNRLDGIEMIRHDPFPHREWYRYLNCGYRLPIVGGTDKMSSDVPVGMYRTYANLPDGQEFTYENWCNAVKAGRTMLSGGPIIHLRVDDCVVGDTVSLSGPGTIEVEAWAESVVPMARLDIVMNGEVVASTESHGPIRRLELTEKIEVDGHSWIAARAGGPGYFDYNYPDVWTRGIFAHTSPIYLAVGGEWEMFDLDTAQYMLTLINGDITYIRDSSRQYPAGRVTHHHGQEDHQAYLEQPFHEARAAVLNRMDARGIAHH